MDTLEWILLESPLALGIPAALALFFLLVRWRQTCKARPLLIGLIVVMALFIVQTAVTTPRERVRGVMHLVERALLRAAPAELSRALARDFQAGPMDRERFISMVGRRMRDVKIVTLTRTRVDIQEPGEDDFSAEIAYRAYLIGPNGAQWVTSAWRIRFRRTPEDWRIIRIEPVHVLQQAMPDWDSVESLR